MTLTQLRYLVAIVDANLNISLAATKLNTTQPGISKQLRQMEDELGFEIFIRKGKSLEQLTAGGARLIDHARTVLNEVQNIRAIAANHRSDTRGQLRIASAQTLGRFVLLPALAHLKARFPGVYVRLTPAGEMQAMDMLERDQADLAFVSTESGDTPTGDVVIPLFCWRRVFITTQSHPLASLKGPIKLSDLADVPLVTYESATTMDFKLGRAFHAQGVRSNIACTARDADTIKTCVRLDFGVGLIPELALLPSDTDFVVIGDRFLFPESTTWAVMRRDRIQRDYVFELLGTLAPWLKREDIRAAIDGTADLTASVNVPEWRTITEEAAREVGGN